MDPHPSTRPLPTGVSRRAVLGVTAAGAAGLLTAACGGGGSCSTGTASGSDPTSGSADPTTDASGGLVATSDVPVGSGVFVENGKIIANPGAQEQLTAVVTQPSAGVFKAFNATCTHMSCTVGEIKNGQIICPCHGSEYSIKDGSVTSGPAPKPLRSIAVKVDGDKVVKA
jgi:Rieske Fe-S protein